jgi:hypothetical protein
MGSVDAVIREKGLKSENLRAKIMFQQCRNVIQSNNTPKMIPKKRKSQPKTVAGNVDSGL